jgi:hypothetical protein
MSETTYAGIDYGLGMSNVDKSNGIRYGVISQHSINLDCMDDVEYDYGKPTCPKCGNEVTDVMPDNWREIELESYTAHGCDDYVCVKCKILLDSGDVFADEPLGWSYDRDGYQLTDCLDSDIFIIRSPYWTRAQYCSPCVPGAGNLDSPCEDGPKTYCLGHDWFEDGQAPYKVYSVADDSEVLPDTD